MFSQEELYSITALADNEIKSTPEKDRISSLISSNNKLRDEYKLQCAVKNMLNDRFAHSKAPQSLKESVIQNLKHEVKINNIEQQYKGKSKSFIERLTELFSSPVPAFATVILLAVTSYFLFWDTGKSVDEMLEGEKGEYNMFSRAEANYSAILGGKLKLQAEHKDPRAAQKYFAEQGVEYSTKVPACKIFKLAGSVISNCKGEKLAHNLFFDDEGKLLYLFQVPDEKIKQGKVLLSEDLLTNLDEKPFLKCTQNDKCIFIWKAEKNIFIVLTNSNPEKVEKSFLPNFI